MIALDVGKEPVHLRNPYLPLTRSEAALPLRAGLSLVQEGESVRVVELLQRHGLEAIDLTDNDPALMLRLQEERDQVQRTVAEGTTRARALDEVHERGDHRLGLPAHQHGLDGGAPQFRRAQHSQDRRTDEHLKGDHGRDGVAGQAEQGYQRDSVDGYIHIRSE